MDHFLYFFIIIHWKKAFSKETKIILPLCLLIIAVLLLHIVLFLHIISEGVNCIKEIFIFRLERTLANKVSQYEKFIFLILSKLKFI